jgi:hypothetical protein
VPPLTGIRNESETLHDPYPSYTAAARATAADSQVTQRDRVMARSYRRRQQRIAEATEVSRMAPEIAAHNAEEARENAAAVLEDDLYVAESGRIAAENERLARARRGQRFGAAGSAAEEGRPRHVLHLQSEPLPPSPGARRSSDESRRRRDRDEDRGGSASSATSAERTG